MGVIAAQDLDRLLELYKHPHCFGVPDHYEWSIEHRNPACGDSVWMYASTDSEDVLTWHFGGESCSYSVATASVLCDLANEKGLEYIRSLDFARMTQVLPFAVPDRRADCARLPFDAMAKLAEQIARSKEPM